MKATQIGLFDSQTRLQMRDSIRLTVESLQTYGAAHEHWAIAWSGGKDSTALVTLVVMLLAKGLVPAPKSLTVLQADTRLEFLPLWLSCEQIKIELSERGIAVTTVMAETDKRFLVYMLGRGVPPPNNLTMRWCTRQIKIDPMQAELKRLFAAGGSKVLLLTGVRQGESAIRDGRIAMSCSKDGAECGQGWYQQAMPDELCSTLAPLLHWRVCHVWAWLKDWAPTSEWGDWSTELLADAYGGDEAEEHNARTGCIGCPLVERDKALEVLLQRPQWAYLEPLARLRPLWRELRKNIHRLRKPGGERRADGSLVKNQQRMGPLTIEARRWALGQVMAIQSDVNHRAELLGRPKIDLLNAAELARVNELIDAGQWPDGWSGDEPIASEPVDLIMANGSVQPLLFRTNSP